MTSNSEGNTRTVLVVGGRGFVGSHVVRRLVRAGIRPHVFGPPMVDDLLADLAGAFGETEGSVEDRGALVDAIRASGADMVVTTAAHSAGRQGLMKSGDTEGDRAMAVNVLGLRNVFEAAVETGIGRVVWTGSTTVYGPAESYPNARMDEDAPCGPVTLYGLTKLIGEDMTRFYWVRHGLHIVCLRLPLLLGPGLWYHGAASAISGIARAAAAGGSHSVAFHDEAIDLMHVSDAAEATLVSLDPDRELGPIYNINGFTASLSQIIALVESRVPGFHVEHDVQAPALTFPLIDDARFREDAGFSPAYDLARTVADLLEERQS